MNTRKTGVVSSAPPEASEAHAQDDRGIERAAQRSGEFLFGLAACIRALSAKRDDFPAWWRAARPFALSAIFLSYICVGALLAAVPPSELVAARDHQDLAALNRLIAQYRQGAQASPQSTEAQYKLALANSYAAEVAMELRDKKKSEAYAEAGMDFAQKAASANGNNAEYHRLLGELCGQVIPANPIFGALKYGQCARDEIDKAIQLDGRLALAFVSRGVGNYYLPSSMGGGLDVALKDFDKALSLDPKLSEAYLWKGVTLRKANRNAEARQAFQKALEINPQRAWTKQQLDKTPAS